MKAFRHMYKTLLLLAVAVCLLPGNNAAAQQKDSVHLRLLAETYVSYLPGNPASDTRPGFYYNYVRNQAPALNQALARLHYSRGRFRSNVGMMTGDYAFNNLAQERGWAQHIYELNAGVRISHSDEIWLDVGVLPSHIGIESAIGPDNLTATRSIVADNSPYYETGIRASYQPSEHWYVAMLVLNGWQRITAPLNQFGSNWGLQVTHRPNKLVSFNSSSFIGKVPVEGDYKTRVYSNLYGQLALNAETDITLGWDFGAQTHPSNANRTLTWNGVLALVQHRFTAKKLSLTGRYEYFADPNGLLFTPNPASQGFSTHHWSANLDWKPVKGLMLRTEANYLAAAFPIYLRNNQWVPARFSAFFIVSYQLEWGR